MTDPRDSITNEALPPGGATPPGADRLEKFIGGLDRMEAGWGSLLGEAGKLTTSMVALRWAVVICIGLLLVVGVGMALHANSISDRVNGLAARLDEITSTLEQARGAAQRTEEKVTAVGEDVAEARAEAPKVTLVDAGAGKAPKAAIAFPRPAKPAPVVTDAGAAPAIVLPVTLPPGSRTIADDAGAQ